MASAALPLHGPWACYLCVATCKQPNAQKWLASNQYRLEYRFAGSFWHAGLSPCVTSDIHPQVIKLPGGGLALVMAGPSLRRPAALAAAALGGLGAAADPPSESGFMDTASFDEAYRGSVEGYTTASCCCASHELRGPLSAWRRSLGRVCIPDLKPPGQYILDRRRRALPLLPSAVDTCAASRSPVI